MRVFQVGQRKLDWKGEVDFEIGRQVVVVSSHSGVPDVGWFAVKKWNRF